MFYEVEEENKTSNTLRIAGWLIIIFGIPGSLILGAVFPAVTIDIFDRAKESYNWVLALGGVAVCGLSGLLFLGMSEVICLLNRIRWITKKSYDKIVEMLKEPDEKKG